MLNQVAAAAAAAANELTTHAPPCLPLPITQPNCWMRCSAFGDRRRVRSSGSDSGSRQRQQPKHSGMRTRIRTWQCRFARSNGNYERNRIELNKNSRFSHNNFHDSNLRFVQFSVIIFQYLCAGSHYAHLWLFCSLFVRFLDAQRLKLDERAEFFVRSIFQAHYGNYVHTYV